MLLACCFLYFIEIYKNDVILTTISTKYLTYMNFVHMNFTTFLLLFPVIQMKTVFCSFKTKHPWRVFLVSMHWNAAALTKKMYMYTRFTLAVPSPSCINFKTVGKDYIQLGSNNAALKIQEKLLRWYLHTDKKETEEGSGKSLCQGQSS